ncbi:MAG: DivIVA domain-containing protein [Anaerotruncus sp.]|nr:DivIVA domain-containing protein [Anaerotruncus sp.]
MLNPNEIASKKFDRVMGRGYKVDDVEGYLNQIANEMSDLIEEKQDLEKKLMVLADKLEEYKHDEESLRAALLGAQKLGDSVVRDARAKAQRIVEEATSKSSLMLENAKRAIEREQSTYVRIQREVATFKSRLQLLYKQHLELIGSIPVDEALLEPARPVAPPAPAVQPEPESSELSIDTDDPVDLDTGYEEELSPLAYDDSLPAYDDELPSLEDDYEPEPVPEPEPEPEPRHREPSRFGPLKFGRDFDIKRDR